jgi:Tn7-like transposition protein D/TniQ
MLGFFTDPYPDELIYSACARYSDRMRFPSKSGAVREWFGENATAVVDLPGRLGNLVSQLPPGHHYNLDRLLEKHTLLPFYSPFIPPKRLQDAKQDMQNLRANRIHARLGIIAGRYRRLELLRFCPLCVVEDRAKYGETYWHRLHQISGVEICPRHDIPLEQSKAPWLDRSCPSRVISAESTVHEVASQPRRFSDTHRSLLFKIASDAEWILRQQNLNLGPEVLRHRYFNLLLKQGYAFYNGRIRTSNLTRDFRNFFSPSLLESLQCPMKNSTYSWVTDLALKDRDNVVQNPIRHILLITFLGYSAEQFFTSFDEYKAFGSGPWPCLNHASDHFKQPQIVDNRVVDSLVKGKAGRPMGIFSCECGFIYTRMGPDKSEDDICRADSVRAYGHVWEETLRELWVNPTFTIREMACTLGVYEATVVRRAIQMGLPYPRNPSGPKLSAKVSERYLMRRKGMLDALEDRRRRWLDIIKAHPNASRKQLMGISNYLYSWLRRNDLEWFEKHLPPTRNTHRRSSLIDWTNVDNKLSTLVRESATRIKNLSGRPVRVSITTLTKEIGCRSWLEKRLDKLPLTARMLKEYLESLEAFELRKVLWAEESYVKEESCPSRIQFMTRADVRNKTGKATAIQSAVNASLESLNKRFGGWPNNKSIQI